MTVNLILCAFLFTISPWILNLSRAHSFCSYQEQDEQCGEHSYHIIKPMLQYFEQINLKTAESDQKILAYENERKKKVETIITKKIASLEAKVDRLTRDSEYKKEVISLQKQAELKDAQIGNFQILLQIKEKIVSDLHEANRNSLIQISEMKNNIESLKNRISQQETQLGDYTTQISNCTLLISQQNAKIGEYSIQESKFTTILQGKEKQVSDFKKDFEQIEIANTGLKKTVKSLNSKISQQEIQLGDYSTQISNYTMLISQQKAKIEEIANLKNQVGAHNDTMEKLNKVIAVYEAECKFKSCETFKTSTEVHLITVKGLGERIKVRCDGQMAGPGWTVIQRRQNGTVDFYRNWEEYKNGFGDLDSDFFIGLEKLHHITKTEPHELYIYLEDFEGETRFVRYDNFAVGSEQQMYALIQLGNKTGSVSDVMKINKDQKFSTFDRDNDSGRDFNCAESLHGGWWYNKCGQVNLNGKYKSEFKNEDEGADGIYWADDEEFHDYDYSLKKVQMMIRPARISKNSTM